MRAIDGDALRDRLQNLADDEWNRSTPTSWAEAFTECADMVEDAPTIEPEPHWIPCSERLPEERGYYLTTTKNGEVYCDYWNEDNFDRTELVIAWMPLPEPYKEGES